MTERIKPTRFGRLAADPSADERQSRPRKLKRRALYRNTTLARTQIQGSNAGDLRESRASKELDPANSPAAKSVPEEHGDHSDGNGTSFPVPALSSGTPNERVPPCTTLAVDNEEGIRTSCDILPSPTASTATSSFRTDSSGGYVERGGRVYRESMRQYKTIDLKKVAQLAAKIKGDGNCEVLEEMTQIGGSNIILFLAFDDDAATRWVARFPVVGPLGLTSDYDMLAESMESMVATMDYVSAYTSLPVPAIHHWTSSCNNEFGRPYVIMDAAKGNSLYELQSAGFDLDEMVDKFSSFVDQWAQYIAELAALQFNQIGSLVSDAEGDVVVGPLLTSCNIRNAPLLEDDVYRGPFNSVADYLVSGSHLIREAVHADKSNPTLTYQKFLHSKLIESLFPFYVDPTLLNGPFVVSHIDFDLQNILVDETNNFKITGIVDWDLSAVLPLQSHLRVPDILMCDQWTRIRRINRSIKPWQLKFALKYRDHFKWCLIKHLRDKGLDYPAGNLLESGYMFGRFQRAISEDPQDEVCNEIWSHVYGTELSWKDILSGMRSADWGTVMAERLSLPIPVATETEAEDQLYDATSDTLPSRPETTETFWNHFKRATWTGRVANKLRWGWWHIEQFMLCQMGSKRVSLLNRRGFSELSTNGLGTGGLKEEKKLHRVETAGKMGECRESAKSGGK